MAEQQEATAAEVQNVQTSSDYTGGGDFWANNQKTIVGALAVVLVAALGYFGYNYYLEDQDATAQTEMFKAVYYFESDSLDKALKGANGAKGLEYIAENYGGTKAGMQASYYCGVIYLKKGKFDQAIEHLQQVNFGDELVQARAYSLIGDANLELKKYDDAISYYKKAADHYPNKAFTPTYLMKLALAQELNNDLAGAIGTYSTVLEKYNDQGDAADARKYKALLEQKLETTK